MRDDGRGPTRFFREDKKTAILIKAPFAAYRISQTRVVKSSEDCGYS